MLKYGCYWCQLKQPKQRQKKPHFWWHKWQGKLRFWGLSHLHWMVLAMPDSNGMWQVTKLLTVLRDMPNLSWCANLVVKIPNIDAVADRHWIVIYLVGIEGFFHWIIIIEGFCWTIIKIKLVQTLKQIWFKGFGSKPNSNFKLNFIGFPPKYFKSAALKDVPPKLYTGTYILHKGKWFIDWSCTRFRSDLG